MASRQNGDNSSREALITQFFDMYASPGFVILTPLEWRNNERDGNSNHRRLHCLLNCWFRRRSKKTSKLRVIGLCAGNLPVNGSPVTGEFPAYKASNAENVSIWWRHHVIEAEWLIEA